MAESTSFTEVTLEECGTSNCRVIEFRTNCRALLITPNELENKKYRHETKETENIIEAEDTWRSEENLLVGEEGTFDLAVVAGVGYLNGSFGEGQAHLLEHVLEMKTRGTLDKPANYINYVCTCRGAVLEASTCPQSTVYNLNTKLSLTWLTSSLEIFRNMIYHPIISIENVLNEAIVLEHEFHFSNVHEDNRIYSVLAHHCVGKDKETMKRCPNGDLDKLGFQGKPFRNDTKLLLRAGELTSILENLHQRTYINGFVGITLRADLPMKELENRLLSVFKNLPPLSPDTATSHSSVPSTSSQSQSNPQALDISYLPEKHAEDDEDIAWIYRVVPFCFERKLKILFQLDSIISNDYVHRKYYGLFKYLLKSELKGTATRQLIKLNYVKKPLEAGIEWAGDESVANMTNSFFEITALLTLQGCQKIKHVLRIVFTYVNLISRTFNPRTEGDEKFQDTRKHLYNSIREIYEKEYQESLKKIKVWKVCEYMPFLEPNNYLTTLPIRLPPFTEIDEPSLTNTCDAFNPKNAVFIVTSKTPAEADYLPPIDHLLPRYKIECGRRNLLKEELLEMVKANESKLNLNREFKFVMAPPPDPAKSIRNQFVVDKTKFNYKLHITPSIDHPSKIDFTFSPHQTNQSPDPPTYVCLDALVEYIEQKNNLLYFELKEKNHEVSSKILEITSDGEFRIILRGGRQALYMILNSIFDSIRSAFSTNEQFKSVKDRMKDKYTEMCLNKDLFIDEIIKKYYYPKYLTCVDRLKVLEGLDRRDCKTSIEDFFRKCYVKASYHGDFNEEWFKEVLREVVDLQHCEPKQQKKEPGVKSKSDVAEEKDYIFENPNEMERCTVLKVLYQFPEYKKNEGTDVFRSNSLRVLKTFLENKAFHLIRNENALAYEVFVVLLYTRKNSLNDELVVRFDDELVVDADDEDGNVSGIVFKVTSLAQEDTIARSKKLIKDCVEDLATELVDKSRLRDRKISLGIEDDEDVTRESIKDLAKDIKNKSRVRNFAVEGRMNVLPDNKFRARFNEQEKEFSAEELRISNKINQLHADQVAIPDTSANNKRCAPAEKETDSSHEPKKMRRDPAKDDDSLNNGRRVAAEKDKQSSSKR